MPPTVNRTTLNKMEEQLHAAGTPIVATYINILKQMYDAEERLFDLQQRMTAEEQKVLEEVLGAMSHTDASVPAHSLFAVSADYLTVKDVARLLGISDQMVRRKCSSGKISAWRTTGDSGEWRIDITPYQNDPKYAHRLADLLRQKAAKQERKQRTAALVRELSEMPGCADLFDDINERAGRTIE